MQRGIKTLLCKNYFQSKAREREKLRTSDSNNNSDENEKNDENDESSSEEDVDNRFGFVRTVPDNDPKQKKHAQ